MLNITMQDLIIRLDEQRNVVQLLVPTEQNKAGALRIFHEISENEFLGDNNLESHIGTIILSFLSATYSTNLFGLDKYREASKNFHDSMHAESIELLKTATIDSNFEGILLYLHSFDETWSVEDIDGVTALLERLVTNGSDEAAQFLRDDWPVRSVILKQRLSRTKFP